MLVDGGSRLRIDSDNIYKYDGATILMQPARGTADEPDWSEVQILGAPAELGSRRLNIVRDDLDNSPRPVKIVAPDGYPISGWLWLGLIHSGESASLEIDPKLNRIVQIGAGLPYPHREMNRTFVATEHDRIKQLDWRHRDCILRVSCEGFGAEIRLPDPAALGWAPGQGYARTFKCSVMRVAGAPIPWRSSADRCVVFPPENQTINYRPHQFGHEVRLWEFVTFRFDAAQWWATEGRLAI